MQEKIDQKNPPFSRKLLDHNPLRENSALTISKKKNKSTTRDGRAWTGSLPPLKSPLSYRPLIYTRVVIVRITEKGGLTWRGAAFMTETAMAVETARTVKTATFASLCCILKDKHKQDRVLSRTAKTVKTAKTIMKATPLKLNRPFPWSWQSNNPGVKTSTGNDFPRKYPRSPRNYYQYWCQILATFLPFGTGDFLSLQCSATPPPPKKKAWGSPDPA